MTKRANPFAEDFLPQSKTHVGFKQFNNNEERMKNVYVKTLELLFKGAKKIPVLNLASESNDVHNSKDKSKQLFIGNDGKLLHSGHQVVPFAGAQLCLCGVTGTDKCNYCEAALCESCLHTCGACQRPHCARCSLESSEGNEMCVSCYT